MGSGDEPSSLFLLLQSLFKLHRYHVCLQSAVQAFLFLLQADNQEGTKLWAGAIREVMTIIDSCLTKGKEHLLSSCDARLLKRLVTCILKTIDIVDSMTLLYSVPTCLLWKTFYILISRLFYIQVSDTVCILITEDHIFFFDVFHSSYL